MKCSQQNLLRLCQVFLEGLIDERWFGCDSGPMRWDHLFADLEARFDEIEEAQLSAELADRQRVEMGSVWMSARLTGAIGSPVRLRLAVGAAASGVLTGVGPDWVIIQEAPGREALVSLWAVTMVEGLLAATGRPVEGLALRLDLRRALRGIARDRSPVAISLMGGSVDTTGIPGSEVTGTIDRVGADFIELALHAPWEARRSATVRRIVLLPLSGIVLVRAVPLG